MGSVQTPSWPDRRPRQRPLPGRGLPCPSPVPNTVADLVAGSCARYPRLTGSGPTGTCAAGRVRQRPIRRKAGCHRRMHLCRRCARNQTCPPRPAWFASCPSPGARNGSGTGRRSAIALTAAGRLARRARRVLAAPDGASDCHSTQDLASAARHVVKRAGPAGPAPSRDVSLSRRPFSSPLPALPCRHR